ncbi:MULTISPECIES: diacylglycerol kinase family protein [Bacillus]|uniref:Diacylglycerol kinase n=2 Tax=Bacillus cereus group TaxID=86661 RepID=R8Q2G7_BACCE|nr:MULTISPECIES: diacylglycerol kinase family protein [Bacillus cereus group]EOP65290.1 diacylglycerol kinase [Bacillus cereus VD118]MBJ7982856.1 diacylglycerol kinase family protein [Bacillus cereus]MBJ8092721.1 diacylglycerol kinase family protein [Bacillus cereus]MCQ6357356.1 diacylglycerol kinase family protein [Bacillus cereus]OOQ97182.1 diacylglycerol kinase [Bacillus cereus]
MKKGKLLDSFGYAIAGIYFCLRHERNMKIHSLAAVIVMCCGFYFHITTTEWIVLLIVIGIVMGLEMVNTAIEKTVDLATADIHPFAKIAKDVAAGAVLLFAIIAAVIGAIIFLPYMV